MNADLEMTKNIVAAMAGGFGGDGRLAAKALRKVSEKLKQYDSADAKKIATDIMVAMGTSFEGDINNAVRALDRILASMVVRKKASGGAGELDVKVVED